MSLEHGLDINITLTGIISQKSKSTLSISITIIIYAVNSNLSITKKYNLTE